MVDMTGNILDIRVDNTQSLGNINSNSNTYHVRDITQMLFGLEMMYVWFRIHSERKSAFQSRFVSGTYINEI